MKIYKKPKKHPWGYDWFCWEFSGVSYIIIKGWHDDDDDDDDDVGDDDKLLYGDAHPSFKVCGKQPPIGWEGAPTKHQ